MHHCGLSGCSQDCTKGFTQDSQSQVSSKQAQRGGGRRIHAVVSQGTRAILHKGECACHLIMHHREFMVTYSLLAQAHGQLTLLGMKEVEAEKKAMEKPPGRSQVPTHHIFSIRAGACCPPLLFGHLKHGAWRTVSWGPPRGSLPDPLP